MRSICLDRYFALGASRRRRLQLSTEQTRLEADGRWNAIVQHENRASTARDRAARKPIRDCLRCSVSVRVRNGDVTTVTAAVPPQQGRLLLSVFEAEPNKGDKK